MRRVRMDLDVALKSVIDHTSDSISRIKERLESAERVMKVNDPTRQLKLGYSIVRGRGKVIKSVEGLNKGDMLEIQFSDGTAESNITSIN